MYLESWIQSTEKDANMRIGLVCSDITISSTIGDSRLNREIKIMMFKAPWKAYRYINAQC